MSDLTCKSAEELSVLDTYRYLRGGMAAMIVMLGAGVVIETIRSRQWLTSISAYYYSATQAVFVSSLCALGILLIAYRGSSNSEDELLNLAGLMAFVVAFVPTKPLEEPAIGVDPLPAILNNVSALIIAMVVAQGLSIAITRLKGSQRRRPTLGGTVGRLLTWIAILIVALIGLRGDSDHSAHLPAAFALFIAITIVVGISAWLAYKQEPRLAPDRLRYCWTYVTIAAYMVMSAIAVISTIWLYPAWDHRMLVVEVLLIVGFAVYWFVQTYELWDVRTALDLMPEEVRNDMETTAKGKGVRALKQEINEVRELPADRRLSRLL